MVFKLFISILFVLINIGIVESMNKSISFRAIEYYTVFIVMSSKHKIIKLDGYNNSETIQLTPALGSE